MNVQTRVVIRARYANTPFYNRQEDFGIPYEPDREKAARNDKVTDRVAELKKMYPVVDVYFRDTN